MYLDPARPRAKAAGLWPSYPWLPFGCELNENDNSTYIRVKSEDEMSHVSKAPDTQRLPATSVRMRTSILLLSTFYKLTTSH